MFKDFREFLAVLEKEGQLVRYADEIVPEPEVRLISRAACDMGSGSSPAVLMDNIRGYKGQRLAVNVHGSWANHALMLGMPKTASLKEQFFELEHRWDKYEEGKVEWIDSDKAPCHEAVLDEGAFNLLELLPCFKINEYDGGFYLSKASVVSKDPDEPDNFDKENVGIYRIQMLDADTLSMQGLPFHDIAIQLRKAEERNEPLPVAICLGMDPVISFMASTPIAYDQSEYKMAAALKGAPVVLTKTTDGKLDVPAGAEFVLEGEIVPRVRIPEGPFGEFPGSYSGARRQVLIKIRRVTHRKDPIFENLYIGRPWGEIDTLGGLNTSISLFKQITETMPEVVAINAMYQHGLTVVIAVNPRFGGYAKSVAFRAASTPHGISYVKNIILVDGDVDPFDLEKVMWAMSTRIRGPQDVFVIPGTPGMPLDPSSEPPGMGVKVVIDATTPVAPERQLRDVRMVCPMPEARKYQDILTDLQKAANKK